jgi:murein DD-endopeptidase MepM/ murein hydrolase activator NlpD
MAGPRRNIKITGLLPLSLLLAQLSLPVYATSPGTQTIGAAFDSPMPTDAHHRLLQTEKRHLEVQRHLYELRKKIEEKKKHIKEIDKKLNKTTAVLAVQKQSLVKTDAKIEQTAKKLDQTQETTEDVTAAAARRLREIFEGQRISFLEMLFQVDSLQSLLDGFYFQERVAERDKALLETLRAKAAALAESKNKLGQQRDQLGNLVSQFAKKAMEIAKQKFDEEQVASKLKTQQAFYEEAERQLAEESHRLENQIQALESSHRKANKNMAVGSGNMALPISAPVTSPFGWRRHPIFGVRKFHTGVDLAGPNHSAIRAADSGNVLYTGWYGGYGKVVIVSHGNGMATLYAHMSKTNVEAGQNISKGDIVGYEGTTGFSTGPHLHFEVRVNGKPNNPLSYLK